ncbi:MAG: hypothetical protein KKC68_09675, partial [Candidatus Thermoplasmatota archaeon]|nr:hypothetical protein [Candidatus Thermoplasmatota archaeon]
MKIIYKKRVLRRSSPNIFGFNLVIMLIVMMLIPTITAVDVRPVPNPPSFIDTISNDQQNVLQRIEKHQPLLTIANLEPVTIGQQHYYYAN